MSEQQPEPEQVFSIRLQYYGPDCSQGMACDMERGFACANTVVVPALAKSAEYTAAILCRGLRPATRDEQAQQWPKYDPLVCDIQIIDVVPSRQLPSA
ncbi:MAG TPA: hypothetical protein VLI54_06850 [Bacillota bacterium]|nr:hypothetical protein [Bacillota bacterium]